MDHLDPGQIGAVVCYTLDGQGSDLIDVETFSADLAEVTVRGVNIHPSIAKGRMSNAVRAAAGFSTNCRRIDSRRRPPPTARGSCTLIKSAVAWPKSSCTFCCATSSRRSWTIWRRCSGRRRTGWPRSFPADRSRSRSRAVPQHGRRAAPRAAGGRLRPAGPGAIAPPGQADDRPRRDGRFPAHRAWAADAEPRLRRHAAHSPLEWACLEEMVLSVEWLVALAEIWAAEK